MIENKLEIKNYEPEGSNYSVVDIIGEFDSFNIKERKKMLLEMIDKFSRVNFVLNFSQLIFINSEGISLLMEMQQKLALKNQKLVIVSAKKNVVDVLKVIGLLESVPYFMTLEDFENSVKI